MKLNGRQLAAFLIVLVALIQGTYGIQVSASGGRNGESDSVSMNLDTLKSQTINDNSLVLALNLDNNTRIGETSTKAVDESRYQNNGTISGATWTSAGRINSALQFDGIDDHVDCGNSSALDITDNITIELWIKPEAAQEACWIGVKGNYGVMAKADAGIPGNVWS